MKLQMTQNYAAKSLLGMRKYSSATEALEKLDLLPVKQKCNVHLAVFAHKTLHGKAPTEQENCFLKNVPRTGTTRAAAQGILNNTKHRTMKTAHTILPSKYGIAFQR